MTPVFHRRLALCFVLLSGCTGGFNRDYPRPDYTTEYRRGHLVGPKDSDADKPFRIDPDVDSAIGAVLGEGNRFPAPWLWEDATTSEENDILAGYELYHQHCLHCHGVSGNGNGPTAKFLDPRPRDYRRGQFKWKSTRRGQKPTRDDLARIIKEGATGSSMPPFKLLPEEEIRQLVAYVIYLSKRGEVERRLLMDYDEQMTGTADEAERQKLGQDFIEQLPTRIAELHEEVNNLWDAAAEAIVPPVSEMPRYAIGSTEYEGALKRGKDLFTGVGQKLNCYQCHSKDGVARPEEIDKEQQKNLVNDWGYLTLPRNLRLGLYFGGRRPIDIYRRIHEGIDGTGMPAQGNLLESQTLKPNDIWDLVYFIRALPYRADLVADVRNPTAVASAGH